jgi:hypothetical protein
MENLYYLCIHKPITKTTMDKTKTYEEYADSILETKFDIEDVIDGSSNGFNGTEYEELKRMREYCKLFIDAFDALEKLTKTETHLVTK